MAERKAMSPRKAIKTSALLVVALAVGAAHVHAASCPSDKALYSFEFNGTRTVYTQKETDIGGRLKRVRFETLREDKPVWSVEGEIYCDDIVAFCTLKLDRPAGAKESSNAESDDNPDDCTKFILAVTEIYEGEDFSSDEIAYIAFGGLTQFTLACRQVVDLRITDRKRLSDAERDEGMFALPSYVRFSSCGR